MQKVTLFILFLLSCMDNLQAQQSGYKLEGKIMDCEHNLPIFGVNVRLSNSDSSLSASSNNNGQFKYANLASNTYHLEIFYTYSYPLRDTILLNKDTSISVCLQADSSILRLFAHSKKKVDYYVIGLPEFSEMELNAVSVPYNLTCHIWGCVSVPSVVQHNIIASKILNIRIGKNWEKMIEQKALENRK